MALSHEEWLKQSEYDLDTAEFMLGGGRCFYAVFMAHLATEKALKALFQAKLGEAPPKTHNLVYLLEKTLVAPPADIYKVVVRLSQASVATRYPENLAELQARFDGGTTRAILASAREALQWIRQQF